MRKPIVSLILLALFIGCGSPASNTSYNADTTVLAPTLPIDKSGAQDTVIEPGSIVINKWEHKEDVDPMDNTKTIFARLNADSTLSFDFPYGESTFSLLVRKKKGSTDIMVQCSSCQFLDGSFDDKTYRVKFDDEPPFRVGTTGSSSGSSDVVFLESVQKLIKKMKTAKRMIIEPDFYGSGRHPVYFTVDGFKWQ